MVKFQLGDFTANFGDWAKHHKEISVHVQRTYNGKKPDLLSKDPILLKAMEDHKDKLVTKTVRLFDRESLDDYEGVDTFLKLRNTEYKERDLDYYSVGASNTSNETTVRIVFKLEDMDFIIEKLYKTSGSGASSFYDMFITFGDLDTTVQEIAEDENIKFEDKGIMFSEDDDEQYHIVALDEYKYPTEFDIEKEELLRSLIAIEIIEDKMTIH